MRALMRVARTSRKSRSTGGGSNPGGQFRRLGACRDSLVEPSGVGTSASGHFPHTAAACSSCSSTPALTHRPCGPVLRPCTPLAGQPSVRLRQGAAAG